MQLPATEVKSSAAIGVFDSGVGGLSVLRAIREQLPHENLLYVADSRHAPYGERQPDYINERCQAIATFLNQQPVKALVIACNTASVVSIEKLRATFSIPIVGIEPAIKPAASVTRSGVVGVLATSRTLQSAGVQKLCDLYAQNVEMILKPCPGLVERIERSELTTNETRDLVAGFVQPLIDANADTIVLGCTHYPFVSNLIQDIAGNAVTVIEPGAAVARQLCRRLDELKLNRLSESVTMEAAVVADSDEHNYDKTAGTETFFSTGEVGDVASVLSALWGRAVALRYLEAI